MSAHGKGISSKKTVDMELVYASMIAYPDDEDALVFLHEQGYTQMSLSKMKVFRRGTTLPTSPYYEPYLKRREQLAPRIEAKLAEDLLNEATRATTAINYAVERCEELLAGGEASDPARMARDLSQIRTQAIDKRLALQGRPTQISEHRNVDQIVAELERLGAVKSIDAEATAVEESTGSDE